MFQTLKNAWAMPELRKKILYTLFIILIFRFGSCIPVPFIDTQLLAQYFEQASTNGSMLGYLDITPGSVSVMGLMNDHDNAVRLLVDEDVLKGEWVGCHPCINTSSLRIKTKDMFGPVIKAMHHDMTVVKLTGEA